MTTRPTATTHPAVALNAPRYWAERWVHLPPPARRPFTLKALWRGAVGCNARLGASGQAIVRRPGRSARAQHGPAARGQGHLRPRRAGDDPDQVAGQGVLPDAQPRAG